MHCWGIDRGSSSGLRPVAKGVETKLDNKADKANATR